MNSSNLVLKLRIIYRIKRYAILVPLYCRVLYFMIALLSRNYARNTHLSKCRQCQKIQLNMRDFAEVISRDQYSVATISLFVSYIILTQKEAVHINYFINVQYVTC